MTLTAQHIAEELARTIPVLEEEADRAMHEALDLTKQRWAETAPHGATGNLASRVSAIVRHSQTGVSGTVQPRSPEDKRIAGYVNDGTGVYATFQGRATGLLGLVQAGSHSAITPKAGRGPRAALRFADGSFRKRSRGQRPTHFIERTKESSAVEVEDILTAGAVKATERLFR